MNRTIVPQPPKEERKSGKKEQMRKLFDSIAPSYDRLNHLFSLHIDRLWRRRAVRMVSAHAPRRILDLATGTGDLAIGLARRLPEATIVGVDLSEQMLEIGRRKVERASLAKQVTLVVGDAEQLTFGEGELDVVTVGFGVRNFACLDHVLTEMFRVLRPGGVLVILELTTPPNRLIRWFYEFYSFRFMPLVGGWISHQKAAYRYLPASVRAFDTPEQLLERMRKAGFESVEVRSQTGGIAHLFSAIKPQK